MLTAAQRNVRHSVVHRNVIDASRRPALTPGAVKINHNLAARRRVTVTLSRSRMYHLRPRRRNTWVTSRDLSNRTTWYHVR